MEGKNIIEALENIDEALGGTAGDAINIVDALNQIAESLKNKSGGNNDEAVVGDAVVGTSTVGGN